MDNSHAYDLIIFFLQIGVMLAVALLFGQLMRRINQPAVLGELLGGILIGPTVLGALTPGAYGWLFPGNEWIAQGREAIIRLGLLYFLFVAGLEVSLAQVGQNRWSVLYTSLLGWLVPFGLGFGATMLLPGLWGQPGAGQPLVLALFIGTALSISALPVITRILMDLRLLRQRFGVIIISAATINDLIGWSLFAVLLGSMGTDGPGSSLGVTLGWVFLFSGLTIGLGRWLGRPLLDWARRRLVWPSGFIGVITILLLLAAAAAEWLGIHSIFGAFLVGVALQPVLAENGENQAHDIIYQFAISLFAPLYFVSIGLKANFAANFDLPLVLLVVALATLGKVAGAGLGAWLGGINRREALAIGFGMNARGAIEIILASVALDFGLIDQRIFVALVIMALATSMTSGPLLQWLMRPARA